MPGFVRNQMQNVIANRGKLLLPKIDVDWEIYCFNSLVSAFFNNAKNNVDNKMVWAEK